jgi:hypothetical protein
MPGVAGHRKALQKIISNILGLLVLSSSPIKQIGLFDPVKTKTKDCVIIS